MTLCRHECVIPKLSSLASQLEPLGWIPCVPHFVNPFCWSPWYVLSFRILENVFTPYSQLTCGLAAVLGVFCLPLQNHSPPFSTPVPAPRRLSFRHYINRLPCLLVSSWGQPISREDGEERQVLILFITPLGAQQAMALHWKPFIHSRQSSLSEPPRRP